MDTSLWSILLLTIGLLLLMAEVFIPSGGLISVLAACALLAAVWCAWFAWWGSSSHYFWIFLGSMAVLLPAVVSGAFYVWPNTAIGRKAILEAPAPEELASFVELEQRLARLVGATGEAATSLNPAGIALVRGERLHCQSEGAVIDKGTPVRVISVKGHSVVVRVYTPRPEEPGEPPDAALPENELRAEADPSPPLDFDLG